MNSFNLLCLSILCLSANFVKGTEQNSPVLLWSPERSLVDFPDVSSVDSFTASDFYDHYLSPLMQNRDENAVVFLQDKLSIDDFTKYADVYSIHSEGGAFKNVRRLMEDHFSLEIPEVNSPLATVEKLKNNFNGIVHVVEGLAQLKSLKLDDGKRFLLIVNLHPVIGSRDEEKTITENDCLVGDVAQHLKNKGIKYSALFTGKPAEESQDEYAQDDSDLPSNSRHLLATPTSQYNNETCKFMDVIDKKYNASMYIFLCGFSVCVKTTAGKDDCTIKLNGTIDKNVASLSKMGNNSAEVILQFNDVEGANKDVYNVKITVEVALQTDRWVMQRYILDLASTGATKGNQTDIKNATINNMDLDRVVPRYYSFHCTQLDLYLETVFDTTYKEYAGTRVTLKNLQFQVFDSKNNVFYHAQDCVGFFTTGIWMGIFTSLLLLFILITGTMMMLNLSVMDKFDNPKGKTITVNVSE